MKTAEEIMEILDMMQFFGGQRAGRELWADKPMDVQNTDIEAFNKNIEAIREYIRQLEAERDAAVRDLTEFARDTDESCEYCLHFVDKNCSPECRMKNEGFVWRGVQKEG